jgi:hypothetical protein
MVKSSSQTVQELLDTASLSHEGGFFYGVREKNTNNKTCTSSSPVFASSGVATSTGKSFTSAILYSWGSCGKFLTGLVLTKMMEEGLLNSYTTLNSIDSNLYSGTATYFTSISVLDASRFPFFSDSYSYTTNTFQWSTLTIGDLLRYNLGLSNDLFFLPSLNLLYFNNAQRSIILSEGNLQGLGMMIQFGIAYSALVNGNPITPGCKIYNGESYRDVLPTAVSSYIELTKTGVMPLLYNTNTYATDLLPFRERSLPATYDFSYAILGDVMDKLLKKNGYTNFSDYVHQKIFTPLGMTTSYILFQDTVPPDVLSTNGISENSWRRAPVLGLTATVNTLVPSTWPGQGCSPEYAATANGNVEKEPYGPLVWNSQYPNDGISYLTSLFYCTEAIPGCPPLGNAPLLCSIVDMGKLLSCVAQKGFYTCSSCLSSYHFCLKKSIVNRTSWGYYISNKVNPATVVSGLPYPLESLASNSSSVSTGLTEQNRDITNNTLYAFDESSFFKNGVTGCTVYINPTTGVWCIFGFPEAYLSSGYLFSNVPPSLPFSDNLALLSSFITAVNL